MSGTFRMREDIALADVAFEASGDSPSELCHAATRALIELLAEPTTVGTSWTTTIERDADTLADLVFDWLNELVYLKDAELVLFHRIDIECRHEGSPDTADGPWRLHASLVGAPIDPATQVLRSDVKAVTKHLYRVERCDTGWRALVVVDV
ncbi:MAG: archease [Nitrospiraceae bacterium]